MKRRSSNTPREKRGGSGESAQPAPPPAPSAGVRLEVAILSDQATPAPVASVPDNEPAGLTVLVVAAEADVRHYVRECLRDRDGVRVLEAETVTAALTIAAHDSPALLVVDAPESEVLVTLSQVRAIVIVDDVPRHAPSFGPWIRFLARPFTGDGLVAEVGRLLA
jgi:hypothetical protein